MPVVIDWLDVPTVRGYDPWQGGRHEAIPRGFCVALLSFSAFLWGAYLAGIRTLGGPPLRQPLDRSLGVPSLLFTLGAVAMVAVGIAIVGPSTVFGLYGDWWDAKRLGADQRFLDQGMVFSWAGVFALLASDEPRVRWRRYVAYVVFVIVAVIAIQKGDRTGLIALGVGAGWCYTQRIGRLRWPPVLAATFVVLLVLPVIREWRSERSLDESARSSVLELLSETLYSNGSSVSAIVYSVELIPSEKSFEWGSTFWIAALNAIPNVTFTKGKEWASATLEENPSGWITATLAPNWYATGGGYGFAMAAEWYYNFGMPGVWFGMALIGYMTSRVRNASARSSLALVWSATFFAAIAIWIRNVLGFPLKVALWPIFGLIVVRWLVNALLGRRRKPAVPPALPAGA
jgi:oligosaccharide repeat unit polymerase